MSDIVRIVPSDLRGAVHLANGTKVLMPDGTEMPGVTEIVLTAKAGDIWRAQISCFVAAPEIVAKARVGDGPPQPVACECATHCLHARITQPPRRPGTYCREARKAPPKPPVCRIVVEGRRFPQCDHCGSSMMRKRWFFFGERPGCIQPECAGYGGSKVGQVPPRPFDPPASSAAPGKSGTS